MPIGFMFMPLIFFGLPIATVGFFGWLALRYVRARERDVGAHVESARSDELTRIEDALLALQSEVHSLRERQEFVERLLERPRSEPVASTESSASRGPDENGTA